MFAETLAAVPVRGLRWGPRNARVDENVERVLDLLRAQIGNRDAERVDCDDAATALGPAGAPRRWFERRRRVPDRVVRVPELCWTPRRRNFGRAHWIEILRVDPEVRLPFPPPVAGRQLRGRDARGQRDALDRAAREQQPRLCVEARGEGRFDVTDRHVHAFRLLLSEQRRTDTVEVRWRGQTLRKPAPADAAVLLREFVERFDRTFLPIAEVRLP